MVEDILGRIAQASMESPAQPFLWRDPGTLSRSTLPEHTRAMYALYIRNVKRFTLQFSYSHLASVGHLVKSRAATNYILYNRLTDETGTASYELDLPNGGLSYIIGNIIRQSPNTQNSTVASYLEEGNCRKSFSGALRCEQHRESMQGLHQGWRSVIH
jgi:hypothetical protein